MRITKRTLNSRIARRLFMLLMLVVLIPIVLTGAVSYDQIHKLIYREQAKSLRIASKEFGLGLLSRLTTTEEFLKITLASYEEHGTPSKAQWNSLSTHFSGVWVVKHNRLNSTLLGEQSGARFIINDLANQSAKLVIDSSNPHAINVFQITSLDYLKDWVIIARLDPEYLWPDSELNAYEQLCVISSESGPLHCNLNIDQTLLSNIQDVPREQLLEWTKFDGEAMVSAYWRLFLGHEFNTEDWFIVISKPEQIVFHELSLFKKVYMPGLLLALLLSIFVTFKLVKRHLAPFFALNV